MLAVGYREAKKYDKNPILLAKSNHSSNDLYYVKDGILPCQNCKTDNPLEMLSQKTIFALKKKYKVSARLLKRLEETYKNQESTDIDLGNEAKSLNGRIFINEIEKLILNSLKTQIRMPGADWLPAIHTERAGDINQHVQIIGPSGAGKSTFVTMMIERYLPDALTWAFGPVIESDPKFLKLQKSLGKRQVKLINANKIEVGIELQELKRGSRITNLILDDPESMQSQNLEPLSSVCSKALYMGRHHKIICWVVSHNPFSRRVKTVVAAANECTKTVLFPNSAQHGAKKFMKNRLLLSSEVIKRIFKFLKKTDRWCAIVNTHPCCVITSTGAMLL